MPINIQKMGVAAFFLAFILQPSLFMATHKVEEKKEGKPAVIFKAGKNCKTNANGKLETKKTKPNILRVLIVGGWGGVEEQTVTAYKYFLNKNYNINILVATGSKIEKKLDNLGLDHYHIALLNSLRKKHIKEFRQNLFSSLIKICKNKKIDIIHCHKEYEYEVVASVAKFLKISAVAHYHSHEIPEPKLFKGFDVFIASSPKISEFMKSANVQYVLGIKDVQFISPPHNEDRFVNFVPPSDSRKEFFAKNFGVNLKDFPLLCMIANLNRYKNHKVLLDAIKILTDQNLFVELILAGGVGALQGELKKYVQQLGIDKYVHFLGFTDKIPELLFYSDIKILASKQEAFGIVLLEAALMRKPIILSNGADLAGILIKHGQTGLIFDSLNANDLAKQITLLISDPSAAKTLGDNAYELVSKEFSTKRSMEKFEAIYNNLFYD